MGEAATSGVSRVLKIVFYLAVIAASSCMLYGFVNTAKPLDKCTFGGSLCVLFGDFSRLVSNASKAEQGCVPSSFKGVTTAVGGNDRLCHFCVASASGQLVLAVIACILVVCRIRLHKPGRSAWAVPELIVVVMLLVIALTTAIIVSVGLAMFCERVENHWEDDDSIYRHLNLAKPGHCRDAALTVDGKTATAYFYKSMNLAQVGAWVATSAWVLHFFLSLCGAVSFRKHGATPRDKDKEEKAKKEKKEKKEKAKKEKKEKQAQKKKAASGKRVSAWETDQSTSRLI